MMSSRRRPGSTVSSRGSVQVTVSAIDEQGFTHQYAAMEVPVGRFREVMAALHAASEQAGV